MEEVGKSEGAEEKAGKKRSQRVQLACLPCRQGKLKCNRDFPVCDQCYKRSRESSCVYTERGLRYNAAKQKAESMREKIDRLETFVNRLKDSRPSAAEDDVVAKPKTADATMQLLPMTGLLKLSETGSTRYVGPANWESILEDISDVKAYFDTGSSPGMSEPDDGTYYPHSNIVSIDLSFGISGGYTKQDLLQFMPPKAEMDRLVSTWFHAMDNLRLLIHGPTFQKEYGKFWQNPLAVPCAWLALLFAVTSLGAELSGQARGDLAVLGRAEDLRRLTIHALVLADYISSQPYTIETILLHVKSLLLKHHDTTRAIFQIHGQVMRLCFQAGMHRDPRNHQNLSPFDSEMRRRVWMFALEYDCSTAYQLGMSTLLHPSIVDAKPPGNYFEEDISPDFVPPPRNMDELTPMLSALCFSKLVYIFGEITLLSHRLQFPSRSDAESLRIRLEDARNQFPQKLQMVSLDQSFMDSPSLILDRFRLEMLYLKGLCVLHRSFLNRSGFERESERCLDAAEETIRNVIPLLEATSPGGQLESCAIFVRRHVHEFNLAAMLMCSELKRQSTSASGPEYRDILAKWRPMLLKGCALWNFSGVTSPKARHAIRSIESFLQQDAYQIGKPAAATGPNTDATVGQAYSGIPTSLSLIDANTAMAAENLGDYLNIEQDPLFQNLFGSTYPIQQGIPTNWG